MSDSGYGHEDIHALTMCVFCAIIACALSGE